MTAEVFHKALKNIGSFEWRGASLCAWLYRIAANEIADRWKSLERERNNPNPDQRESSPDRELPNEVEECERRALLYGLVRGLPADQKRVIELRFAEEKSIREIAKELGRTEGAVKQLQFRAMNALRTRARKQAGKVNG